MIVAGHRQFDSGKSTCRGQVSRVVWPRAPATPASLKDAPPHKCPMTRPVVGEIVGIHLSPRSRHAAELQDTTVTRTRHSMDDARASRRRVFLAVTVRRAIMRVIVVVDERDVLFDRLGIEPDMTTGGIAATAKVPHPRGGEQPIGEIAIEHIPRLAAQRAVAVGLGANRPVRGIQVCDGGHGARYHA